MKQEDGIGSIDLTIRPLSRVSFHRRLVLISFEQTAPQPLPSEESVLSKRFEGYEHAYDLERELIFT